jgi:hypothetical protein
VHVSVLSSNLDPKISRLVRCVARHARLIRNDKLPLHFIMSQSGSQCHTLFSGLDSGPPKPFRLSFENYQQIDLDKDTILNLQGFSAICGVLSNFSRSTLHIDSHVLSPANSFCSLVNSLCTNLRSLLPKNPKSIP